MVKRRLLKRWKLWDHDTRIVADGLSELGWGDFSGIARERVRWVDTEELPPDVRAIRKYRRTVRRAGADLEQGKDVLLFSQRRRTIDMQRNCIFVI